MSSLYTEVCDKKGISPLKEVLETLNSGLAELKISSKTSDTDLLSIASLLTENLNFLKDLELKNQNFSENGVSFLAAGLQENKILLNLSLTKNNLNTTESIKTLCSALNRSATLEYLDISENAIQDQAAEPLKDLIITNKSLKVLKLDRNLIENTSFAASLCENESLKSFSISYNPLTVCNFMSLLEMLSVNKGLLGLAVKGIRFESAGNIENSSNAELSIEKNVILKLSSVLRKSYLRSIEIDLDPSADLQLRDLENSLLNHNTQLLTLSSDNINWEAPQQGALLGIQRALKANLCLLNEEDVPIELLSIVNAKKGVDQEFKTLKNFGIKERESDSRFSSSVVRSPDLRDSQYLSDSKEESFAKDESQIEETLKWRDSIQSLDLRFQRFQEKAVGRLEILERKVKGLELHLKNRETQKMTARISELEKKDEDYKKNLELVCRELSEIKRKNEESPNSQTLVRAAEKKLSESSQLLQNMKRQVEDAAVKVIRAEELQSQGSSRRNDSSFQISELGDASSGVDFSDLPGAAEILVVKAVQEKSYWRNLKREKSSADSHNTAVPRDFYSPEKCPSKDLHERLVEKGMNFVPRSDSESKRSPY